MTAPQAQFWLPTIAFADQRVFGPFEPPQEDHNGELRPVTGTWFGGLEVREAHVWEFLFEITPALRALLLAGYAVPYIDIGLQYISTINNVNAHWLRVDFANRRFELNERAPVGLDEDQRNAVKLGLRPIARPTGAAAVDLSVASLEARRAAARDAGAGERPMAAVLDDIGSPGDYSRSGSSLFTDPDPAGGTTPAPLQAGDAGSTRAWRTEVMKDFVYDLSTGEVTLDARMEYLETSPDPKVVRPRLFKALSHGIFDALAWYVGGQLLLQAEEAADFHDPETDGASPIYPGLLELLNPDSWSSDGFVTALSPAEQQRLDHVAYVCREVWRIIAGTDLQSYRDQISADDGPAGEMKGWKDTNLLTTIMDFPNLVRGPANPDLTADESDYRLYPMGRVLDRQFAAGRLFDKKTTRAGQTQSVDHDWMLGNLSLSGLVWDVLGYTQSGFPDDGREDAFVAQIRIHENNLRNEIRGLIRARNPGLPRLGQARSVVQRLRYGSYVDMVFSLFNTGLFSVQAITGNIPLLVDRPRVYAQTIQEEPLVISLLHSGYPGIEGLQLAQVTASGHSLPDSFAWEFIPAPPPETIEALRSALAALDDAMEDALSRGHDRLIIVAAPGVQIDRKPGWPENCPIEIYRVQSHGQVPEQGQAINTDLLDAPQVIMAFDDLEPMVGETTALDIFLPLFQEHPELHPTVQIKRFRSEHLTGVRVSTQPQGGNFHRGVDGTSTIEIAFDPHLGTTRYALDLRYRVLERTRSVDTESEQVTVFNKQAGERYTTTQTYEISGITHVIQFELVVHKTPNVRVNIADNNIGFWADAGISWLGGEEIQTTFVHSFFNGPFPAIKRDGSVLETTAPPPARAEQQTFLRDLMFAAEGSEFEEAINGAFEPLEGTVVDTVLGVLNGFVPGLALLDDVTGFLADDGPEMQLQATAPDGTTVTLTRDLGPEARAYQAVVDEVARTVADIAVGFIPVVGDGVDAAELMIALATDRDRWGRPVTNLQKAIMFGCVLLPFVSAKMFSALKAAPTDDGQQIFSAVIENHSRPG